VYEVIWQKAASLSYHPWGGEWVRPILTQLIHGFLDSHEWAPKRVLGIGSAVFAQHTRVTNTQTDRPRNVRHLQQ